jgi:hypothetical protein
LLDWVVVPLLVAVFLPAEAEKGIILVAGHSAAVGAGSCRRGNHRVVVQKVYPVERLVVLVLDTALGMEFDQEDLGGSEGQYQSEL